MKCFLCGHSPKLIDPRIKPMRCKKCGAFRLGLKNTLAQLFKRKHNEPDMEDS